MDTAIVELLPVFQKTISPPLCSPRDAGKHTSPQPPAISAGSPRARHNTRIEFCWPRPLTSSSLGLLQRLHCADSSAPSRAGGPPPPSLPRLAGTVPAVAGLSEL